MAATSGLLFGAGCSSDSDGGVDPVTAATGWCEARAACESDFAEAEGTVAECVDETTGTLAEVAADTRDSLRRCHTAYVDYLDCVAVRGTCVDSQYGAFLAGDDACEDEYYAVLLGCGWLAPGHYCGVDDSSYVGDDDDYIPWDQVCDGTSDCRGGDDELPENCPFECDRGYTIPMRWICDGYDDCQGGEDEVGCP